MKKLITISILMLFFTGSFITAETKKMLFFGSYNFGFGMLPFKVSSDYHFHESNQLKKLKPEIVNQFEVGAFYNSFGLGVINNQYSANASTSISNVDINSDGMPENGIISDKLRLNFTGLEFLYKTPMTNDRFCIKWKIALGVQWYSMDYQTLISDFYIDRNLNGSIFDCMLGAEINYNIWKRINLGAEISMLPGFYNNLRFKGSNSNYFYHDNVSRINTGLKLTVTL